MPHVAFFIMIRRGPDSPKSTKMKKLIFLATISCIAVFTTFLFSCQKDACANVKCQHGGTCSNGLCKCPTGYEGNSCERRISDKFVGTYIGTDCDGSAAYILSATSNTTVDLKVSGLSRSMHASVSGNSLAFSKQTIDDGAGNYYSVEGNGNLNGNSLSVILIAVEIGSGDQQTCAFNGSK